MLRYHDPFPTSDKDSNAVQNHVMRRKDSTPILRVRPVASCFFLVLPKQLIVASTIASNLSILI